MGHKVKNLFIAMSVAAGATAMDAAVPMPASAGNPADYCPDQPCIPDTPCGPHKPPHHGGGKKVIINKSYTKNSCPREERYLPETNIPWLSIVAGSIFTPFLVRWLIRN